MVKVNAISVDYTAFYNLAVDDASHIKAIKTVYIYEPDSHTHLCELTPSYFLSNLYTYIEFADNVSDDKREYLDQRYCYEDSEDTYMHCSRVGRMPERKECGNFDSFEDAREYLQGNCPF